MLIKTFGGELLKPAMVHTGSSAIFVPHRYVRVVKRAFRPTEQNTHLSPQSCGGHVVRIEIPAEASRRGLKRFFENIDASKHLT